LAGLKILEALKDRFASMPFADDPQPSRATVAERVIFVTRKSLKSKMPPHINSPFAKFMPSPSSCDGFEAEMG
jgi:hypothetical protein